MTTSPAPSDSSHDSGDENHEGASGSKGPAAKDRECQYCHQKFTSSSLGRHLDQFLSKKKPDGIHNVDEIRRLRGGITRRTARNSHRKEQDESRSTQHSPSPQYTLPSYSELLNKTATTKEELRINRPHWQASGVITDPASLNPPYVTVESPSITSPSISTAAGQKRSFSTYASDLTPNATSENLRALELSLREVLDAVRIATKKAAPPSKPFDFDFESQTFPYLCLALLPTPPTLFQSTPFGTSTTISLSPPGPDQYQAVRKTVNYQVDHWKWNTLSYIQRSNPQGTPLSEELDNLNETAQTILETCFAHLDAAYQHFMSYGVETRHMLWTIEMLRALKTEQDKVQESKAQVERMTQEASQLQQQLDHLSRCQWPREMALWPPDRPTFNATTLDELRKVNVLRGANSSSNNPPASDTSSDEHQKNLDRWDYDRIVAKWRKHVREDRARRTGVQPSVQGIPPGQPLPPAGISTAAPDVNSPNSTSASTPRITSSLSKSMSDLPPSIPTHASTSRPGSALAMAASADGPPDVMSSMMNHAHMQAAGGLNGSGTANGYDPSPLNMNRRRIGILSDVDEHYGPRLAGLRRDR